jgi:hypothetical protein
LRALIPRLRQFTDVTEIDLTLQVSILLLDG